jgi:hypothetical protein
MKAHKNIKGIKLFFSLALVARRWLKPRPGRFIRGKTRYLLKNNLCGPQGRYGILRKNFALAGIHSRATQFVASCYTDCSIPTQNNNALYGNNKYSLNDQIKYTNTLCRQTEFFLLRQMVRPRTAAVHFMVKGYG